MFQKSFITQAIFSMQLVFKPFNLQRACWVAIRHRPKGAVIIYGWGAGANPNIGRTQDLPPLDNRAPL